jgi:hypothetical protein
VCVAVASACAGQRLAPGELPDGLAECEHLPALIVPEPVPEDHVIVVVRVRNEMRFGRTTGLCLTSDGAIVNPSAPDAGIPDLVPGVDFPIAVRRGTEHSLMAIATVAGEGRIEGYRFQIKSRHRFTASTSDGVIEVIFVERGTDDTPVERRPTVEWRERLIPQVEAPATVPVRQ